MYPLDWSRGIIEFPGSSLAPRSGVGTPGGRNSTPETLNQGRRGRRKEGVSEVVIVEI